MKVAYIDHKGHNLDEIEREFEVSFARTYQDFQRRFGVREFPVLLFHPGYEHYSEVVEVLKENPRIKIAIVTDSINLDEYSTMRRKKHHASFGYLELEKIKQWIGGNSGGEK